MYMHMTKQNKSLVILYIYFYICETHNLPCFHLKNKNHDHILLHAHTLSLSLSSLPHLLSDFGGQPDIDKAEIHLPQITIMH